MSPFLWGWMASVLCAVAVWCGVRWVWRPRDAEQMKSDGQKTTRYLAASAFGAGVLLIAVLCDFLPDAWEEAKTAAPWCVLAGVGLLWAATLWSDHAFWRRSSSLRTSDPVVERDSVPREFSPASEGWPSTPGTFAVSSAWVLGAALSLHSFLEGSALTVAVQQPGWAGWLFPAAMVVHKLPEGVLWGVALQAAYPRWTASSIKRAQWVLGIPPLCTLLGSAMGMTFAGAGDSAGAAFLSAGSAGALLFICLCELLPMLREHGMSAPRLHGWFAAGGASMLLLTLLARAAGG
ncbi:MAG: ZIP family metal transporter [Alicyclobacillus macrosporangiidus]|uniref:ZIP family metal transporter n=1 Tax=Alicyclobacillus macrosporangiidus TaxID=392015 RepID=UPI0026EF7983|nr:ZIP family metal transporter [Alicyclobacillus macrosporangiidus]MCL6599402.1 ZIP family metal transporter [Alicyclobacillus macrosporangiidus]